MPGPALAHNASEYSPAEAEEAVFISITQNYVLCATSVLLVYELLVTFDEEVERVWSLKWRLPKLLFFLNRYITRALLLLQFIAGGYPGTSAHVCQIYAYWQVIPPRLAILAAQAVMVIRLWAIYNNSRPMLYLLVLLFALEVTAVVACGTLATLATQGSSEPPPLNCGLDERSPLLPQYASGTWIAPVCFELIILIITLVKVYPSLRFRYLRKANCMKGLSIVMKDRNPTLNMLARDSIIYFTFIFTFTLANAIIYELDFQAYYHSLLLGPTSAISCIAVSRMIINIRSLPEPNFNGPSTNMVGSGVIFAENSEYDEDAKSISDAQASTSQRLKGRVKGKEREVDGFEMASRPGKLPVEGQIILREKMDDRPDTELLASALQRLNVNATNILQMMRQSLFYRDARELGIEWRVPREQGREERQQEYEHQRSIYPAGIAHFGNIVNAARPDVFLGSLSL
ncbi:hypothetical protein DFH07DRAFT_1058509 [Mycena maculata]|uniref:DUF6533 domain-containing protein n=1 Tax=Mycena maculata TaxID=230809 RepID=A0AAD7JLK4_9AGAR|nr:hypothetical protein DFH07DRAFT_1058509 [Mycena maculata]